MPKGDFGGPSGGTPVDSFDYGSGGVSSHAYGAADQVTDYGGNDFGSKTYTDRPSTYGGDGSTAVPGAPSPAQGGGPRPNGTPAGPGSSFAQGLAASATKAASERSRGRRGPGNENAMAGELTAKYGLPTAPTGLFDPTPSVAQRGTIQPAGVRSANTAPARQVTTKDVRAPGATMLVNERDPYGLNKNPNAFTPPGIDPVRSLASVLEVIRGAEARPTNPYGSLVYGTRGLPTHADLENMTIAEVQTLQRGMPSRGYASTAVGAYQTIANTLNGAVRALGLDPNKDRFDQATQDRIGAYLAQQRGYDDYQAGRITAEQFADRLAREWAGLPVATTQIGRQGVTLQPGQSYYDRMNGNAASVGVDRVLEAIGATQPVRTGPPEIEVLDRVLAALPPERPADMRTASAGAPLPPDRPADVDAVIAAALGIPQSVADARLPPERPGDLPQPTRFGEGPTAGMAGMDRFSDRWADRRSPDAPFRGPEGNFAMFGGMPANAMPAPQGRPSIESVIAEALGVTPAAAATDARVADPEAAIAAFGQGGAPSVIDENGRLGAVQGAIRGTVDGAIRGRTSPVPSAEEESTRLAALQGIIRDMTNAPADARVAASPRAPSVSPLSPEVTPVPAKADERPPGAPAGGNPPVRTAAVAEPAAPPAPRVAPGAPIEITPEARPNQPGSANSLGPKTYEDTRDPLSRALQAIGLDTTPASPVTPAPDNWFSRNIAPNVFAAVAGLGPNIASKLLTGETIRGQAKSWAPGNDLTIGTRPHDLDRNGEEPQREQQEKADEGEKPAPASSDPDRGEQLRALLAELIEERIRDATSGGPLTAPPQGTPAIAPDPVVVALAELINSMQRPSWAKAA